MPAMVERNEEGTMTQEQVIQWLRDTGSSKTSYPPCEIKPQMRKSNRENHASKRVSKTLRTRTITTLYSRQIQ